MICTNRITESETFEPEVLQLHGLCCCSLSYNKTTVTGDHKSNHLVEFAVGFFLHSAEQKYFFFKLYFRS